MKKIAVVGTGVMGVGIVEHLMRFRYEIIWVSRTEEALKCSTENILKKYKLMLRKKRITQEQYEQVLENGLRILLTTNLMELNNADVVLEAIPENIEIKKRLYRKIFDVDFGILATNTSSLPITELAFSTKHPDRFLGVHFFNPAPTMKLVEIVRGFTTGDETIKSIMNFIKVLEKSPILVDDSPGFVVNRMLIPMINEAITILAERAASARDIDAAMRNGANHPLGPLSLADLIGTDVCLTIMQTLFNETGDSKYRPHPLLRKMVRAGKFGKKSGSGFFEYRLT